MLASDFLIQDAATQKNNPSRRRDTVSNFGVTQKPRFPLDGLKCRLKEYPGRTTGTL